MSERRNLEVSIERNIGSNGTNKIGKTILVHGTFGPGRYPVSGGGFLEIQNPMTYQEAGIPRKHHLTNAQEKVVRQVTLGCEDAPDYIRGSRNHASRRIDLGVNGIGRMQLSPDSWLVVRDQDAPVVQKPITNAEIWRIHSSFGTRGRRIVRCTI